MTKRPSNHPRTRRRRRSMTQCVIVRVRASRVHACALTASERKSSVRTSGDVCVRRRASYDGVGRRGHESRSDVCLSVRPSVCPSVPVRLSSSSSGESDSDRVRFTTPHRPRRPILGAVGVFGPILGIERRMYVEISRTSASCTYVQSIRLAREHQERSVRKKYLER